jgi:hypothetical protein
MRAVGWILFASSLTLLNACGGEEESTGPSQSIHVAGTYATAVTLTQNSCGAVTVQPNPTTVTHAAGATALTVSHAGQSYTGTLQSNGAFSTTPRTLSANGETYVISISGQFSTTGFVADTQVQVQRSSGACAYIVHWVGTKQGSPNTLP